MSNKMRTNTCKQTWTRTFIMNVKLPQKQKKVVCVTNIHRSMFLFIWEKLSTHNHMLLYFSIFVEKNLSSSGLIDFSYWQSCGNQHICRIGKGGLENSPFFLLWLLFKSTLMTTCNISLYPIVWIWTIFSYINSISL